MTTLWLCQDCTFVECNGALEVDAVTDTRRREIDDGLAGLHEQGRLLPDFDSNADEDTGLQDFSRSPCPGCGSGLAGYRARFFLDLADG